MNKKRLIYVCIFPILLFFNCCIKKTIHNHNNDDFHNQKIISIDGDTLQIKDIINDKYLILRYSELNCNSCIDSIFSILRINREHIENERILLITFYSDFRNLLITLRLNQINYKTYLLISNQLNISEDNPYVPFFFVVDSNFIKSDFFFVTDFKGKKNDLSKYINTLSFR